MNQILFKIVHRFETISHKKIYVSTVCAVLFIAWFSQCLPPRLFHSPYSKVLLDVDGKLLGATIADDQQWRFPLPTEVPEKFIWALTCFEDRRFFYHPGVDPLAVGRALWQNIRSGKVVSGASTITMQVIRLSRKKHHRTIWEKLTEAILSFRLELSKKKDEILRLFAAHAPFGGNVVGLEAASWRYFGRSPNHLTWAETAMIAVLPNNPSLVHPGRNRNRLKQKRDRLLNRLHERGVIDSLTCRLSKSEKLPPSPVPLPRIAPHLLSRVQTSDPGPESVDPSAAAKISSCSRIKTTLKRNIQIRASRTLQRHHQTLSRNGIHNAAALIIDVKTGNILAYVGNIPDDTQKGHGIHVDIIRAPRSTGSILKPLLFAAMVESGELLPTQLVPDIPIRIAGFAPQNYTRMYQGAVPASMALARSLNVPAVNMLKSYGVGRFYLLLKKMGMSTLNRPADNYGLSIILGGAEGTLWDITSIYASLARRVNQYHMNSISETNAEISGYGSQVKTHSATQFISNNREKALFHTDDYPLSPAACWLTLEAMLEVVRPGEDSAWKNFSSSQKIAWKTGTSYGHRDGWAVGITPEHAIGVWVGNADGEGRAGLTGLSSAAPILFDLFGLMNNTEEWFKCPESDLRTIEVCKRSGFRKSPNCSSAQKILITQQSIRAPSCPYCKIVHCDSTISWQVHSDCESIWDIKQVKWFILPPAMEWYYRKKHSDYRTLPRYRNDCFKNRLPSRTASLSFIYPGRNGVIYIPIELNGQRGRTVFKAAHRNHSATIFWHLDNRFLGSTVEIHQMEIIAAPGMHRITLVDENGEQIQRKFQLLAKE